MSVTEPETRPARIAGPGQGVTIVVAGFLPIMAIVALAPAVPSIIGRFAATPNATTLVPLMVTAPGLMIALFSPAMGWAADRVGRRPVLLLATSIYGLLGIAPVFLKTLPTIFGSRLGLGICEAAILTVTNTLVGDYFTLDGRRRWLALQGVFGPIFGSAIIALAGFLTSKMWNGSFLIYAVAFPIFAAMVVYIYEPLRRAKGQPVVRTGEPFPWKTVLAFCGVTLFSSILYYVFIVQVGLAFDAVGVKSPRTLGMLVAVDSVGVLVGAIIFGILSKTRAAGQLVVIYLTLFGLGMIGIGLSRDWRLMTALAGIQQMGAGMAVPSLIYWATGVLSPEHRGRGMGFWSAAFFLGQFASPLVVGLARSLIGGILGAFALMGGVALLGALAGVLYLTARKARRPAPPAAVA